MKNLEIDDSKGSKMKSPSTQIVYENNCRKLVMSCRSNVFKAMFVNESADEDDKSELVRR